MTVSLGNPVGLPNPQSLAQEAEWQALTESQLADTRKTAENWRNGLAGLIGIIAAFSLIKGPSELSELATPASIGAGLLLLAAMICAVAGAWASIEAAYGSPGLVQHDAFVKSGGATGAKLGAAAASAEKLSQAKKWTVASLIFLALAVSVAWYGPRAPRFTLQVERISGPALCGEVVGSDSGAIDIKPEKSVAQRVQFREISKATPVRTCP